MTIGDERRIARTAAAFADLGPGSVGLVLDSQGMYALALDQRSAASELHLDAGDAVVVAPVEDDNPIVSRRRRSPSSCAATGSLAAVRPATTLVIGLLLVAILLAGVIALLRI